MFSYRTDINIRKTDPAPHVPASIPDAIDNLLTSAKKHDTSNIIIFSPIVLPSAQDSLIIEPGSYETITNLSLTNASYNAKLSNTQSVVKPTHSRVKRRRKSLPKIMRHDNEAIKLKSKEILGRHVNNHNMLAVKSSESVNVSVQSDAPKKLDKPPQVNSFTKLIENASFVYNSDVKECKPKTHIMFLKTHKCASSTLQVSVNINNESYQTSFQYI